MIVLRPCAVRHTFRLYIGFTAGRPPLLSVLAAALHLPIVGTWRTRKALGVPYGIAYRRWERKRSQIAKKIHGHGLVRRGRPLTSQTAFGGQLPYKGSLVRPVARFHHSLFEYNGRFLRATSHEQRITSHLSCIRLYTGFVAGRLVQDVPYDSPNRGFSLRAEGHSRRTADCGQRPVGPSDSHLMN